MKNRSETFIEGFIAAAMCLWSFFWMVQPAIYFPDIMEWWWFGFPAHYAFWLVGMVIVMPATCFAYTAWTNRREKQALKEDKNRLKDE